MGADDNDLDSVTEADLAEARERWADPRHEPAAPDLFSEPLYGDGLRGDIKILPSPS